MSFRQLDLTPALRPLLHDDETLIFVQDSIGLYDGKFKLQDYQDGHAYLTTHRICYIGNDDARAHALAIELKDVDRTDFYAGFLKSSPKITLWPKLQSRQTASSALKSSPNSPNRSFNSSPAPAREQPATWICTVCGLPNTVQANFDPATANQYTNLAPCQTCGVKPDLAHILKASIAAKSQRSTPFDLPVRSADTRHADISRGANAENVCPRCTFKNYPSLSVCEVCGASLAATKPTQAASARPPSPGPARNGNVIDQEAAESVKLSFRAGGEKKFFEKLKDILVQRRWLLQSAPAIATAMSSPRNSPDRGSPMPSTRVVGIAGLEQRRAQLREKNKTVMGNAFGDLEALMTSAKEVIAMAEQFRNANPDSLSSEDKSLLTDSATALGLVTKKDMFADGSSSEALYIDELARNLAEYLTDDKRGVLRREGGIMSLVDLWAVFNKTRNGMELISPSDFEKAARAWDNLHLPVRLRQFKSGLLVVQERSRTDDKTIAALIAWLQQSDRAMLYNFGRSATAQQTAEHFGWSVGVATEELEMAEEVGILIRDQTLDGVRFWQNLFDQYYQQHIHEASVVPDGTTVI